MPKTLIVIPCFDTVKTAFFNSFTKLRKTPGASYTTVENTMVHDARNIAAENAIQAGFDRVMWFDSDMEFEPDTLEALERDMDENGLDFVSGLYFTRRPPDIKPVVFKEMSFEWLEDGTYEAISKFYFDYPRDQLFECAGVGFGCCLTSVDLLKRVTEKYGAPFNPMPSMGEDVSFCLRARKLGAKLFCDSRVKCGHVGSFTYSEKNYLPEEERSKTEKKI